MNDNCANQGKFQVTVYFDGVSVWQSPIIYQSSYPLTLNVTGVQQISLQHDPLGRMTFIKLISDN